MNREWIGMIDGGSKGSAERVRVQADLAVRAKQTGDRAGAVIDRHRRVREELAAIRADLAVRARRAYDRARAVTARRRPRCRAVPSYWIAHPTATAFIAALDPDGVGQLLELAADWPVGRYVIREHHPGGSPTAGDDRPWGRATKEGAGHVRIEPDPAPPTGTPISSILGTTATWGRLRATCPERRRPWT
jgi:hypothetical protein